MRVIWQRIATTGILVSRVIVTMARLKVEFKTHTGTAQMAVTWTDAHFTSSKNSILCAAV